MKARVAVLILVAWFAAAIPCDAAAQAARPVSYSGTVTSIDPQGGVLIIEEVGPWKVERGATVTTRRTIRLTPSTRYNLFMRVDAPGAFAGDFIEVEFDVDDVSPGDVVTATCARERGQLVALTVTVAELE
jgi:hypothetical protein